MENNSMMIIVPEVEVVVATGVEENGIKLEKSRLGIHDLPGEVLVHGIIPFISDYHPKDVMKIILVNHDVKRKVMEGLSSFRIVGSEVYSTNIKRTNFKKPPLYRRRKEGTSLPFSHPKKLATQKDLIMLDRLPNLKSITFESLYINETNAGKIITALRKVTELAEIKFVKCKGCFLEVLKPFNEQLTSLQFIDCVGNVFHMHETPFPNCTHLYFSTKYLDGQHKKYKSKLITDLHTITPNLISLTFIDKSSKSFSAATPSFYNLTKLKQLKELSIDTLTFTCPKLAEILKENRLLEKCTLPLRFENLLLKAKLTIKEVKYFEKDVAKQIQTTTTQ